MAVVDEILLWVSGFAACGGLDSLTEWFIFRQKVDGQRAAVWLIGSAAMLVAAVWLSLSS